MRVAQFGYKMLCPLFSCMFLFFILYFPYFSLSETFQKNFCLPNYPNTPACVTPEPTLSPLQQIINANIKVVFLKTSLLYCFNTYGDCPIEGFPSLKLISCIESNITRNECKRLYKSQCGIEFGCTVPTICTNISSPWCDS